MKQTSRKLLRGLCEKNTKASLLAFWADLKSLRREAFIDELDAIFSKKAARVTPEKLKKLVKPDRKSSSDDRPVTRLAFVLQEEKKLSTTEAQRLLVQALVARDHEEDSIPNPDGKSLEEWLEELLLHIPCSEVMDAAQIVRPNQ
jgi:hypothetical protein